MSETTKEHRDCLAKGFPFWDDLTPDEQDMLCRYTRPVHYTKGARVHSPLESCVGILLLRSGQLRSYLLSEDGRDVQKHRRKRKAPVAGGFQFQLVRRIGFEPMTF